MRLGEGSLSATVDVVESLGADALVHLQLGTVDLVAQAPEPVSWESGQTVALRFERTHLFGADGERVEASA